MEFGSDAQQHQLSMTWSLCKQVGTTQNCYRAYIADMCAEASAREHAFQAHVRKQVLQSMLAGKRVRATAGTHSVHNYER